MTRKSRLIVLILTGLAVFCAESGPSLAQEEAPPAASPAFRSTSLPLPRFASLGADKVYVRAGPGVRYPVQWVYQRDGWPVEIILEYEVWRKIKDHDGVEGWVHQSLLSGRRAGLIQVEGEESNISIYQNPSIDARLAAYIEPGAQVNIEECQPLWCKIKASGYKGWIERKFIWGIYENEIFD